jgi:hypothetical protein
LAAPAFAENTQIQEEPILEGQTLPRIRAFMNEFGNPDLEPSQHKSNLLKYPRMTVYMDKEGNIASYQGRNKILPENPDACFIDKLRRKNSCKPSVSVAAQRPGCVTYKSDETSGAIHFIATTFPLQSNAKSAYFCKGLKGDEKEKCGASVQVICNGYKE